MKKKTNPNIKLKEKIKSLEWKLEQVQDYSGKYYEIKKKYDDEFKNQYLNLQRNNEQNYRDNQQFIEIIRWLINKDTALDIFVKDNETYHKRNIWR